MRLSAHECRLAICFTYASNACLNILLKLLPSSRPKALGSIQLQMDAYGVGGSLTCHFSRTSFHSNEIGIPIEMPVSELAPLHPSSDSGDIALYKLCYWR